MAENRKGRTAAQRGRGNYRGRGLGNSSSSRGVCFNLKSSGTCKFGSTCKFSHDVNTSKHPDRGSIHFDKKFNEVPRDRRVNEDPEARRTRANYTSWRSIIRRPFLAHDFYVMQELWDGALEILNDGDRDWKQALPKDLDNDEDYQGRDHIRGLLNKRAQIRDYNRLIQASRSFLLVITHPAMVDCLSVDTYIGSLYNFMSGTNGKRAVPFFQHLCEIIVVTRVETTHALPVEMLDSTLIALSNALAELLRREPRARYNEDLPDLISSLDTAAQFITEKESIVAANTLVKLVGHLRAVVARASGLLSSPVDTESGDHSTLPSRSTYPREYAVPGGRYDNDQADITKIDVFPTREEILTDVKEYLPSTDPDQPHFLTSKMDRHIDTHFRLLRHDTFGKLKTDLGGFMKDIIGHPDRLGISRLEFKDTRTYNYSKAVVNYLVLSKRGDLQARMSFSQPPPIRKKPSADRRKWWEESRRLEEGVLLSFIWIHDSMVNHVFFTVSERITETKNETSLTSSDQTATITIKLASQDQPAVQTLVDLSRRKTHGILLEFPHVLPATFVPVLENLKNMQRLSQLPFREWIIPNRVDNPRNTRLDIPPPLYARRTGFVFDLGSILKPGVGTMSLNFSSSINDPHVVDDLEAKTELDRGQCVALVAALTREFAFIQGPPGTGKSYLGIKLMKVLLDARKSANLGPIIVVCFTNHALDQFLEHLIRTGISSIIRVGGQSRSDLLENHNLRSITSSETKSKHERWQAAAAYEKLGECETRSKHILGRLHGLHKHIEWKYLDRYLFRHYSKIHAQFRSVDNDGFAVVGRHPFDIWVSGGTLEDVPRSILESTSTASGTDLIARKAGRDVHSLSRAERRVLIKLWTEELQGKAAEEFYEIISDARNAQRGLTNVHEEINRRVLQGAEVIGLTTSGLAKNISTLRHVRSKVVICEEAGEVLEAHIISALLPTVEHFIQIGDHQQLRPSINNFEDLSLESAQGILYQLDRSQFERLSVGERGRPSMPVAQLNVQRRMRPEVSTLIRETIYNKLIDHPSTTQLSDVVGMRKNVFWLDHDNMEDGKESENHHKRSKSNDWEVALVHALVRHVVRQGVYKSSDIAVLTPYTGQLQKLRGAMRNDFEIVLSERDKDALIKDGFDAPNDSEEQAIEEQDNKRKPLEKKKLSDLLRVATVDNFQGEEAKVIIVSLVRSNKIRKVGFLKTTNRINVLLSRAQHGMYLIGNTDTYSNVPMWQKVIDMLRAKECVGPSLDLCCPRHMDSLIKVEQPDDFAKLSPEGGCREACVDRLPDCGHRCQARCHSKTMHEVFKCEQPCQRRHKPCEHPCQKPTCGEDCGRCMIILNNVKLPCGHVKSNVACHLTQNLVTIKCHTKVDKVVPGCGHTVHVECSQNVTIDSYRCPTLCGVLLACGHGCPGSCSRCNVKDKEGNPVVKHVKCDKVCGRRFGACNHVCTKTCHDGTDCGLCQSKCEVACKHSRCTLKCHEACAPCVEPCTWSCPHQGECTLLCSAPCNRLPCNQRCTKVLPCGHQCPGLCGEKCLPNHCKECGMKLDAQVDMIEFEEYSEIDLNEKPVVSLACGHFFTAQTLDGMVGLSEVYNIDPATSDILSLKSISSKLAPAIPKCPHCQRPVRQYATQRYNRLINRAVIDEMSKRFIITGQADLTELENRLSKLESDMEGSRKDIIPSDLHTMTTASRNLALQKIARKLQTRSNTSSQLRFAIVQLQKRAAERHQPAHKLHEATVHVMQETVSFESALASLNLHEDVPHTERDHRITFGARLLELRIDCLKIEDSFQIMSAVKSKFGDSATVLINFTFSSKKTTNNFLKSCGDCITACIDKALPRLVVEASLYYARISRLFETSRLSETQDRELATKYHKEAQSLLEKAEKLCEQGFRDADNLLQAVQESLKLMQKEWYEEVTKEELKAIKKAMVSGPRGIATHSGHWYNCVNGHPFAIGECGMPMQLARCPECGAPVGGQNHTAVHGVTRAEDMEG